MFFFFIGGVEPTVKRTLETSVTSCPNCHDGNNMDLVEISKTFKAFFIPVWSFGETRQVLRCSKCKCMMQPTAAANRYLENATRVCSCCGSSLQPGWHFCPTCGVDSDIKQEVAATGVPVGKK